MYLPSCLVLALATCTFAVGNIKIGGYKPEAFQAPSPNTVTSNVLFLERNVQKTKKAAYLRAARSQVNGKAGTANVTETEDSQEFLAPIKFGKQSFKAIIDTGSSDTWLVRSGFQCFNLSTNADGPESDCAFGPTYTPSSTFTQIPNENFNITYADGETLTGIVGREQVTLAGITVDNQEVGVVDYAAWEGDGIGSGLIGLAFPNITSAFSGTDPADDTRATQLPYNPLFTNMYTEGSVAPMFSLALTRGTWGGTLAIGGLPNVAHSSTFATSKLQVITMEDDTSDDTSDGSATTTTTAANPGFQFYTITIQGFQIAGTYYGQHVGTFTTDVFGPPDDPETEQVIVDSGTTLLYVSDDVAEVANLLFDPPAEYSQQDQAFIVECDATPPQFGVDVSGQIFFINPQDLIINSGEGACFSGIAAAGDSFGVLGDVFLKNVLAVFDVGASEMRFAARENY